MKAFILVKKICYYIIGAVMFPVNFILSPLYGIVFFILLRAIKKHNRAIAN